VLEKRPSLAEAQRARPEAQQSPARGHALALLLLVVGVLVAFSDVLGPERGLFFRDHADVYKQKWWGAVEALRRLELPGLTEATPGGVPLESMFNGTYEPSALTFLFGSFDAAYDRFIIVHYILLGAGVLGLALSLGARRREALLAAAIAALSGPALSTGDLVVGIQGLTWAPWIAWGLVRALDRPGPLAVALLALPIGFELQGTIPEVLIVCAAAAALIVARRPQLDRARVATCLLAVLLGVGISAISLAPVLIYLPTTRRGRGLPYDEIASWPFHLLQIPELFAPAFWAPPEAPFLNPPSITGGLYAPYYPTLYLGSSLALATAGLAARPRRWSLALGALLLFGLLMALGSATPLHRLLSALPLLRSSRFPVKYMLLVAAAVAGLAALGLRTQQERPRTLIATSAAQALLLLLLWAAIHQPSFRSFLAARLSPSTMSAPFLGLERASFPEHAIESMAPRVAQALEFALLLFALSLLAWRAADPARRELARGLMALGVLAELALGGRFFVFGAPLDPAGPPEGLVRALEEGGGRLYAATPGGRMPAVQHQEGHTYFEDAVVSSKLRGYYLFRRLRPVRDLDADAQSNPLSAIVLPLLSNATKRQAFRLLARVGAGWITTPLSTGAPGTLVLEIPGEAPQYFTPLPEARPYVRAYARARRIDRARTSDAELLEAATSDAGLETAILFDDDPPAALAGTSTACAPARTTWKGDSRAHPAIEIESEGECPSLVVALETRFLRWTAEVDGEPAPLLTAEFGQLGVLVPAGHHQVRFVYRPLVGRWAALSALCWLVALGLAAFDLARGRARREG
jgi:hypothetical protein